MNNLKTFEEAKFNWFGYKKDDKSFGEDDQVVKNIMSRIENSFDINKVKLEVVSYDNGGSLDEEADDIEAYVYQLDDGDLIYSSCGEVYINGDRLDVTKELAREFERFLIQKIKNHKNDIISNRYNQYRNKYRSGEDVDIKNNRWVDDDSTFDSYKYKRKY